MKRNTGGDRLDTAAVVEAEIGGRTVRRAVSLAVVLVALVAADVLAGAPAALEPFAFLIGEWSASAGQPGQGLGAAVFSRSLQDRVILRTSYAEYPATAGKPASRHDDLLVMHAVPGAGVRADYYDNEGHVIRYVVQSPAPGQAVFLSETVGGQPRFRLSYTLKADSVLAGEFAMAPPDAPEAFKPYLTWVSRKASTVAK